MKLSSAQKTATFWFALGTALAVLLSPWAALVPAIFFGFELCEARDEDQPAMVAIKTSDFGSGALVKTVASEARGGPLFVTTALDGEGNHVSTRIAYEPREAMRIHTETEANIG